MVRREEHSHVCRAIGPEPPSMSFSRAAFLLVERKTLAFPVLMTLLSMALAVYAAGPAAGLLLGAAALGGILAFVKIRGKDRA